MLAYCGLFSLHLLAWTISLTLNLENKAAMSKRTKFNALKISLHLKQNNRSMPGLLSYCWDNVSAWKACNICNGETSESMKHTHTHKMKRKKKKNFQKIQNIIDQIVETVMIQSSPKYIYCLFIQLHTCPFLIWTSVIIQSCFIWLHLFVWTSWQALRPVFRVKCSLGFEA